MKLISWNNRGQEFSINQINTCISSSSIVAFISYLSIVVKCLKLLSVGVYIVKMNFELESASDMGGEDCLDGFVDLYSLAVISTSVFSVYELFDFLSGYNTYTKCELDNEADYVKGEEFSFDRTTAVRGGLINILWVYAIVCLSTAFVNICFILRKCFIKTCDNGYYKTTLRRDKKVKGSLMLLVSWVHVYNYIYFCFDLGRLQSINMFWTITSTTILSALGSFYFLLTYNKDEKSHGTQAIVMKCILILYLMSFIVLPICIFVPNSENLYACTGISYEDFASNITCGDITNRSCYWIY